jgi:uncharacterized protein (TIGR00251 family)
MPRDSGRIAAAMHSRKNKLPNRPDGGGRITEENPFPAFLSSQPDGVMLAIKLQPRASRNEVGELLGAELRIKVTAPPVDAAANDALRRLLAETLDCPRSKVELVRGHTSRHKIVKVYGTTMSEVLGKFQRFLALRPQTA